jgi:hypothetical protein
MGLGQVYAQALKAALAGKANVYRYADALTTLWSDKLSADIPIVIVWDRKSLGESPDDHLLEKHLTPLDWALAWSLKQTRAEQSVRSIVIIDATAGNWKDTWAWSMRHQLLADMPWVTLSAPLVKEKDEPLYRWALSKAAMDNGGATADGVIRKNNDGAWGLCPNPGAEKPDPAPLEWLNKLWVASLRLSDENHDINNIVGARMMLEAPGAVPPNSRRTKTMTALFIRARWSDFHPAKKGERWALPNTQYLYGKTISAILVDDKHESGWAAFLKGALGKNVRLRPSSTPESLIEFLGKQEDIFKRRDFIAGVSDGNGDEDGDEIIPGVRPEIIFLDLRLYGSGASGRLNEDVEKLLAVAGEWRGYEPAWPPIPQEERQEIQSWLKSGAAANSPTHLKALLLLPRLLALALPLTPIILFSATGLADVQKMLKPYRNIFTNFQKPNPLADPESVPAAVSALHQALNTAVPMLRRRLQLAALSQAGNKMANERDRDRKHIHADIFLDETGEPRNGMISAAACNTYSSKSDSTNLHDKLKAEFEKSGVVWAYIKGTPSPRLRKASKLTHTGLNSPKSQVDNLENFLDQTCNIKSRETWAISAIKAPKPGNGRTPGQTLSAFPDSGLDMAIKRNIEFLVFVYLFFVMKDDHTIAIHLPTRILWQGAFRNFNSGNDDFTLREVGSSHMTYSEEAAFPLTRAWLQGWGDAYVDLAKMIVAVRGRTLTHEDGYPKMRSDDNNNTRRRALVSKPHLFHDIADWAAGSVGINGNQTDDRSVALRGALSKFYPKRYVCADETGNSYVNDVKDLEILLDALAVLLRNKTQTDKSRADALHQIDGISAFENRTKLERLQDHDSLGHHRLVIWRLMGLLEKAGGEALLPSR